MDMANCSCETCKLKRLVARAIRIFNEARPAIERGIPSELRRQPIDLQIRRFERDAEELGVELPK